MKQITKHLRPAIATFLTGAWLLTASQASAALVLFTGADPGVGVGGARPNSDAAALAFQAATPSGSTINFEGLALGNFAALPVAPGVTVSLLGTDTDSNAGITTNNSTTLGYNTTSGGSQHLRFVPQFNIATASATFAFATPIDSFGTYLTGLGTAAGMLHVTFFDGSVQDISVSGSGSGGVQFIGFTDVGSAIASVALELRNVTSTRDIFGIDDVRIRAAAVPEPGTALAGLALLGLCGMRRRR